MVVYIYCAVFYLLHRVEELAAYVIIIIRSGLAEMGDHSTTPRATVVFTMFGSITIHHCQLYIRSWTIHNMLHRYVKPQILLF
jgi:hypothetical protein